MREGENIEENFNTGNAARVGARVRVRGEIKNKVFE